MGIKQSFPKLLAHRGVSQLAPENTLAAFSLAKQLGLEWLEFDVMLSNDNIPVIFHDETLKRTTGVTGKVADKTFQQLKKLDAGRKFGKAFAGETIPSLKEVLQFMQKQHLSAVLEIKATENKDTVTVEKTIEMIHKTWPEGLNHIIFSSFSLASLIMLRRLLPKQPLGLGLHKWDKSWPELVKALNCATIHVNQLILTAKRVQSLKQTGCHLLAYTVNNAKRAKILKQWGVDGFFSDCPHKL